MKQILYTLSILGCMTVASSAVAQKPQADGKGTILQVDQVRLEAARQHKMNVVGLGPIGIGQRGIVENDDCAGAEMLTVGAACIGVAGSADGATESVPSEACGGFTSDTAIDNWYSFVATSTATVVEVTGSATTDSTGYDAVLIVYEGSCGALTAIGCADATLQGETESVTIPTAIGTTYYYRTYYYDYGVEQIDLDFSTCVFEAPLAPENDLCTAVTPVAVAIGASTQFMGNNVGALDTEGLGQPNVWHAFTTTECADVIIDYCGTTPAFGNGFTDLFIGCPNTSSITASSFDGTTCGDENFSLFYNSLPAGTYYYAIMLDPANGAEGDYTINVAANAPAIPCPTTPVNDECAGAIDVPVGTSCVHVAYSNAGATQSLAATACSGFTASTARDVWHSFTATSATTTIEVTGGGDAATGFDAVFGVFSGACADLTLISCIDSSLRAGTEAQVITTVPGNMYYYRVYHWPYAGQAVFDYTTCVYSMEVGIEDRANVSDMLVFPNPGAGVFTLRALSVEGLSTIEVFDVTGRVVYTEQTQLNKGADHTMDLTALTAGNYNVRLTAGGVRTTQRLVVK